MVRRLILVKHAMPIIDPALSAANWALSPEGRVQSLRLAERLRTYCPEAVVSSQEPKARETAEILAQHLDLSLSVVHDLHEHDRRGVPLLGKLEFQMAVSEFFANPRTLVFGRETADEAYARFRVALSAAASKSQSQTLVIVAHGTVISLFVSRETGVEPYTLWQRLGLPSFVVISWPRVELLEVVGRIG
jgi:broad specificity phosphatase PhoE